MTETLIIEIPEATQAQLVAEFGLPVSPEIRLEVCAVERNVVVRNMWGYNDADINAFVKGCDHPTARKALELAGGHLVDLRAPMLRADERLYVDGPC